MNQSDARATVKHCIISGLANRAHITRVTAESAEIISEDIIGSLFDDATVWAVVEYAAEHKMHPTAFGVDWARRGAKDITVKTIITRENGGG